MRHHPITVGQEVGGFGVRCSDPPLAAFLAVPEIARFIADNLTEQASEIEADVDKEVHTEITRKVDLAYAEDAYVPGLISDTTDAEQLELEAAAEEDPIARKELLIEAKRMREQSRRETRLDAREVSRANALEREFGRLGSKERESRREENRRSAALLRQVADQITAGVGNESEALVTSWALDRHACVFGSSGSGKTRLVLHLLTEQMKAGCSVLAIDPKPEAVRDLLSCAIAAGVAPEDVVLMKPGDNMSVPGWNPFLGDDPPDVTAKAIHAFFKGLSDFGERMDEVLKNALIVVATHRLSLAECPPLLSSRAYRQALLDCEPPGGTNRAYRQAVRYFQEDFEEWGERGRDESVRAVRNRLNDLLDVPFFSALLCAKRNTLNLEELWRKQKVVIVHLDLRHLSEDGSRIVGGLLAYQAYLTAMKVDPTKSIPVILALDEIGAQEKFLGESLAKITTFSRSQGLRLLVATQHLTRISPPLLDSLLGSAKFQAFFQISEKDAKDIAGSLAAKGEPSEETAPRLEISAGEEYQELVLSLCDEQGGALVPYAPPPVETFLVEVTAEEIDEEAVEDDTPCPEPISQTLAPRPPTAERINGRARISQTLHITEFAGQPLAHIDATLDISLDVQERYNRRSIKYTSVFRGYADAIQKEERLLGSTYSGFFIEKAKKEEERKEEKSVTLPEQMKQWLGGFFSSNTPNAKEPLRYYAENRLTVSNEYVITITPDELAKYLRGNKIDLNSLREACDAREQEYATQWQQYCIQKSEFDEQVEARNKKIRKWEKKAKSRTKTVREEKAARDTLRQTVRLQEASARSEEMLRQRTEEIRKQSSEEFPDSSRLANLYFWLRCNFDGDRFHLRIDDSTHLDLASFLKRLEPCGGEAAWQTDDDRMAVVIDVPEVSIHESSGFNPITKADWERTIQTLPSRHAAVRTAGGEKEQMRASVIRILDVPDALPENGPRFQTFLRESRRHNSQSAQEIEEVERWREEQVDRLAAMQTPAAPDEAAPKPVTGHKPVSATPKTAPPKKTALSKKTAPPKRATPRKVPRPKAVPPTEDEPDLPVETAGDTPAEAASEPVEDDSV